MPKLHIGTFRAPIMTAARLPAPAFALASAAGPSRLGGCEEFEESRPVCRRSVATSARSDSISTACSATTAVVRVR